MRDIGTVLNVSVISKATRISPKDAVRILESVIRHNPEANVDLLIYHVTSERTVTMDEPSLTRNLDKKLSTFFILSTLIENLKYACVTGMTQYKGTSLM